MFYTYILKSKSGELYIGCTSDLKRRFVEHNQGLNPSTKRYRPWVIIYYECCLNKVDAKRRERYFKTTQGRRLLKRRLKEYFYKEKSKDLTN
ncbi:MAG: Excinuclease ABC subunit C [Parcubacteria group bacterium GW2011_GWA2_40_14]|nr:MAG: Excinuclease ABC subunit C [Parcubacteria group bacterium GW2011_GWA2_40_14]